MKRCILFAAELAIVCLAILAPAVAATSPASAAAKVDLDLHQHPTGGKTPVEVSVGLYVTNLVAIDETRETFEVGGYLIGTAGSTSGIAGRCDLKPYQFKRVDQPHFSGGRHLDSSD